MFSIKPLPQIHSKQSQSPSKYVPAALNPTSKIQRPKLRVNPVSSLSLLTFFLLSVPGLAQALEVQITPPNPRQGDTLSVVAQVDNANATPPTVRLRDKTYPMFPVGANRFRALLPTTPLDQPGRWTIQVAGENQTRNMAVQVRARSFPTQRITLRPGAASAGATQHERDRVAEFLRLVTPEKFWDGAFIHPSRARQSTGYGVRRYYNGVFAQNYYHRGLDYAGANGSPIVAPAAGRVVLVGRVEEGFRVHGHTVGVDHGQGVASIFLHLSRIDVKEGDFVQKGQLIGGIGSTGASTGPHLHWGLYVKGLSVDPAPWISSSSF